MIKYMSCKIFSHKKNSRGFTLAELLVGTFILVTAGVAILDSFIVNAYFSALNKGRTAAMTDLSNMMEAVISTPFNNITAKFPNGDQDGLNPLVNPTYANIVGGYTLKNEHITVAYVNPNSDPKEITVTLNWTDGKGNVQTSALITKKTK